MNTNKEVEQYHFEVCPKCGKLHPHLVKGGFSNSRKQMLQFKDCGKRFVVDHGHLLIILISHQINGMILLQIHYKEILYLRKPLKSMLMK